ncbi:MAG TPA: peptide deformylase [Epsilonproteobacteria bacterium]|nr:peptide deformylase [Campylobacterota bacterium]HHD72591.1 peptide deformylase [Campylobacterota bacterium]
MVEKILQYPDERINIGSGNVRFFDEELWELIENLKETAEANDARGLAAIQVAVPLAVVVVKDEQDHWIELINPRIIRHEGNVLSTESTLYLPDVTEEIPRFNKISIVYQDRHGEQKTMIAQGDFGFLLQRKIDYIFGGTFINKLDKKERKKAQKGLAESGLNGDFNACPTFSKREYFKSAMNKLLFFEALSLTAPLFHPSAETLSILYHFGQFVTITVILLIAGYLAYAKYEAEKYVSCTGCQVVGITAVAVKYFLAALLIFAGSYFLLSAN